VPALPALEDQMSAARAGEGECHRASTFDRGRNVDRDPLPGAVAAGTSHECADRWPFCKCDRALVPGGGAHGADLNRGPCLAAICIEPQDGSGHVGGRAEIEAQVCALQRRPANAEGMPAAVVRVRSVAAYLRVSDGREPDRLGLPRRRVGARPDDRQAGKQNRDGPAVPAMRPCGC
jgi:hypothetical protein